MKATEINENLGDETPSAEQLEKIFSIFSEMDIEVVDNDKNKKGRRQEGLHRNGPSPQRSATGGRNEYGSPSDNAAAGLASREPADAPSHRPGCGT